MMKRSKKGFTLIELVWVILVLAILAVAAIPKMLGLRDEAANSTADANIGVIRTAVSNYYADGAKDSAPRFPSSITTDLFQDGVVPTFTTPYGYAYDSATGVVLKTSS